MNSSPKSAETNTGRFQTDTNEEYRLFRQVAPHYDEVEAMAAEAVREALSSSPHGELRVLEIGCGTGITTKTLLQADERISVTAIDNEQEMVRQAQDQLQVSVESGRVRLEVADALAFVKRTPSDSWDAIVSVLTLHNCPAAYRRELYPEIWRALKANGVFINVDKFAADDPTEHQRALHWQLTQFERFIEMGRPELKEKWANHYQEDEQPELLLREGEYVQDLENAHFRSIRKTYRKQMEAAYVAVK